jgi:hypothetical protein
MDAIEGVDSGHVAQIVTIHSFTKKLKKLWRKNFLTSPIWVAQHMCLFCARGYIGRLSWVDSIV